MKTVLEVPPDGPYQKIVQVTAGLDGKTYTFLVDLEAMGYHVLGDEVPKELVQKMIAKLVVEKRGITHSFGAQYEFAENVPESHYNTHIYVNVPYCLHLPRHFIAEFTLSNNQFVSAEFFKSWTDKAGGSDDIEVTEEKHEIYYKDSSFETPPMPQKPELGWQLLITGNNVEKEKDQSGYFRYSRIILRLNTTYTKDKVEKRDKGIFRELFLITAEATNRILEVYRHVMREEHVTPLRHFAITDLLFRNYNVNYQESYGLGAGVTGALVNHSQEKIDKFEKLLGEGFVPPMYDTLLLDAERNSNSGDLRMAVIQSFQAVEIFVENLLMKKMVDRGDKPQDIDREMTKDSNWKIKERLKVLVPNLTNHRLSDENLTLWDAWCTRYDNIRNEVVHKNHAVSPKEARECLDTNRQVLDWLQSV